MTLKKFYFYILFLLFLLPSKSFAENLKEKGIISLMYHRFEENKYPTTNIKTNDFKKQIELIKDAKLEFIGVDQLLKNLSRQRAICK
jgi:hypothetical protein